MSATAPQGARGRPDLLAQVLYSVLLVYYWLMQYVTGLNDEVQRGDFLYYLYVAPVSIFALILLGRLRSLRRSDTPALWTALFLGIVSLTALARGDVQTVASMGLLCMTLAVLFIYRLAPSVSFLNVLFLASSVMSELAFAAGTNTYSVLPGLSAEGDFWWRVSLFPHVATSAFFALLVLLVNIVDRAGRLRKTSMVLALYFLVFAGIRSALVAGVLAGSYHFLAGHRLLRHHRTKMLFLPAAVATFVISLFMNQLLLLLPATNSDLLNTYLFRSAEGLSGEDDAAKTIYRTWIWTEHLRIASQNPLLGVGTFDFTDLSGTDPGAGGESRGSESFLTGLYARVGLPVLLFIGAFLDAISRGVRAHRDLPVIMGIVLFVAMLAYGSFINAYDFVFLTAVGLLNARLPERTTARAAAARARGAVQGGLGSNGVGLIK